MIEIYDFLAGPAAWASFGFCVGGLLVRLAYLYGFTRGRDRVFYDSDRSKSGPGSIFDRQTPPGIVSFRSQPVFAIAVYVFHAFLFAVPICLGAHNILLQESFGISFFSLPESVGDLLTMVFFVPGSFLLMRRIILPEVRSMTSVLDYIFLAITGLPFVTGFLAYHQIGPYVSMLVLHVLSAEILLVVVPFSKQANSCLFSLARAFIGFEMLARRVARIR